MSVKVKFNVIVPTRERADTLFHCLRSIVAQDYENLNIIVSDNFSQDNTKQVVDSFCDPRIKYINTGRRISMSHNWEFALAHVTDGWVTFLGDDDGFLPGALEKVSQVIVETGCSAVTSDACVYYWNSEMSCANQLTVPLCEGVEIRNGLDWLGKFMRWEASYHDLPWLYHGGFASLEVVNAARNDEGKFFLSMIPDVYSAVALASVINNYVAIREPVCVSGVSSHSNGASTLGLTKNRTPAEKFLSEGNIPFHSKLGSPCVSSVPVIMYECYLQSIHLHRDVLKIDMSEQLSGILYLSTPGQYPELKNYCDQVAQLNGIPTDSYKKNVSQLQYLTWKRRITSVTEGWRYITVDARDFKIDNVGDATILAKSIYVLNTKYKNWKWKIFLNLFRRIINFFCKKCHI